MTVGDGEHLLSPRDGLGRVGALSYAKLRVAFIALRPRQWTKNILVFAAPAMAGKLTQEVPLLRALAAFGVFVAAASATYLVNDVIDTVADRAHPTKRSRPVASGALARVEALSLAGMLFACALACALGLGMRFFAVVSSYVLLTLIYSLGLKRVPILELGLVAAGFVLRASGGGAAVHVPISPWFLIVTSCGALLVVAGKRSTEHEALGDGRGMHREALNAYPLAFLRYVRTLASSVALVSYCLWVFAGPILGGDLGHPRAPRWFEASIVPFVLALLAVELAIERGKGGEPEDLALHDRSLQVCGVAWLVLIGLGVYA